MSLSYRTRKMVLSFPETGKPKRGPDFGEGLFIFGHVEFEAL